MNVIFFSTNSNFYNSNSIQIKSLPKCKTEWLGFAKNHKNHNFTIILQKPGMFLLDFEDLKSEKSELRIAENLKFYFIDENDFSNEKIASLILIFSPDIVCPITYWISPFDWLSIKDSLICELLNQKNIKTVNHPSISNLICFDKTKTHEFLEKNNFKCAKALPVHYQMFFSERNKHEIKENVYKEFIFQKMNELKFPVVVKDTLGLSSYGMDVCKTYAEAKHVLLSKKNNGDRLIEEFISGLSFGAEIYGTDGDYIVSPLFINSLNQFGLTSPKQNVKLGPVKNKKFNLDFLQNELIRLARLLNFSGIAQVDLIFANGTWYIIEINSRLSGMTQTIAASLNLSLYELIFMATADFKNSKERLENLIENAKLTFNLKFPLLTEENLVKMSKYDFISFVNQIENHEAKQLRELGYAEVIFGNADSKQELQEKLEILNKDFSSEMESRFYQNSLNLLAEI